ncbi:CDP-alcohol phosphatidyltransferase family protein [Actinomadura sp. 9N407]|uniref:CDP-alcohol phosphatidyltransferase family protein n=1 Tax=Actinomadura sp. 9N407 TaxID=3375154 RepID=UPI0037A75B81
MATFSLDDVRAVRKERDAWWTVLLVDPLAIRLTRQLARTPVTPDQITVVAFALGIGAAVCFAQASAGWLVIGALLYHAGFVLDCCDGKIARLKGLGTPFGGWLDFMLDRVRDAVCAITLGGGLYAATGQVAYLWIGVAILGLDMFRYLNSAQIAKARRSMRAERARAARQAAAALAEQAAAFEGMPGERVSATAVDAVRNAGDDVRNADDEQDADGDPDADGDDAPEPAPKPRGRYAQVRAYLLRHRIRMHLVSGIEFQMAAFIIGPLTGQVIPAVVIAGGMLLLFEMALIARFWRSSRRFAYNRRTNAGVFAPPPGPPAGNNADAVAIRVTT